MVDAKLPVFCLNLDEAQDRWARTQEAFAGLDFVELVRVPGVRGDRLPRAAALELSKDKFIEGGTIGCFLTHVVAWEHVASEPGPALIIEDDVRPVGLERLLTLDVPPRVDLVFVNGRMADPGEKTLALVPAHTAIRRKASLGPGKAGVGGDGYWLTPRGAKRLIATVRRDGFSGHVDGRLFRYSVKREHVFNPLLEGNWIQRSPIFTEAPERRWHMVKALRATSPLIVGRASEPSMRRDMAFATKKVVK
ncbi:MAG TPA: glycosyltransferase family 25 protein [Sphingomonas sp.]